MNLHLVLDFLLISLLIYFMKDHYISNNHNTIKTLKVRVRFHGLMRFVFFILIFTSIVDLCNILISLDFSITQILDRVLFMTIVISSLLYTPNKIVFTQCGIAYGTNFWIWESIDSINIYDNTIDILFVNNKRKVISFKTTSLQEETDILEV